MTKDRFLQIYNDHGVDVEWAEIQWAVLTPGLWNANQLVEITEDQVTEDAKYWKAYDGL